MSVSKELYEKLYAKYEEELKRRITAENNLETYKAANASASAVLQFRELLESLEYQFSAQAPEHLKPSGIDKNFYTKFQNRISHWQWILQNSTDPRAQMLNTKLSAINAVDQFCVMVSSLYFNCSKPIHLPNVKRLKPQEMSEKLIDAGIAVDDWSQSAVKIILFDIPSVPFGSQ